jgi:hypothetical protein
MSSEAKKVDALMVRLVSTLLPAWGLHFWALRPKSAHQPIVHLGIVTRNHVRKSSQIHQLGTENWGAGLVFTFKRPSQGRFPSISEPIGQYWPYKSR